MLLSGIMAIWAVVASVLAVYCIVVVVRPRRAPGQTPRKSLFDFSANQEEGRRIQQLLAEALTGAQTDAEFERNYRRLTAADTGIETEIGWAWLNRSLMEYRKAEEWDVSSLALARRYYEDIPRRYRLKAESHG